MILVRDLRRQRMETELECTHEVIRRERVDYVTFEDGEWKTLNWNNKIEWECCNCGVRINYKGEAIPDAN